MIKIENSLLGKNIVTYKTKGNRKYFPNDISQHLKKFRLYEALALIGKISAANIFNQRELPHIKGIPIYDSVLAYITMELIKNSNDYRSKIMQVDDLLKAIDMYFGLPDPLIENDKDNIDGFFIRFGASQFDYDQAIRVNSISRTLMIYGDLWTRHQVAKKLDINNAISKISGLANVEEVMVLLFLFMGGAKDGFFNFANFNDLASPQLKKYTSLDKQESFIEWVACNYKDFRTSYDIHLPIALEYEKNRFNPLIKTPVLKTDKNLTQGNNEVFLTPVPRLLNFRITRGLYFDLSDLFNRKNGDNIFRSSFGYVFQEYVGILLQKSLTNKEIKPEFKYFINKESKDSPDWFVMEGNRAVVIEVKQSCLYLNAKSWGNIKTIKDNLKQTIGAAVNQFWKFEQALRNDPFNKELHDFKQIDTFEHLIVTYDSAYFSNSILREQIKQINTDLPENYHWHTISIDELEYFLPMAGKDVFELLEKKKADSYSDAMDFNEYCGQEFTKFNGLNPYLSDVYDSFFSKLDINVSNSNMGNY